MTKRIVFLDRDGVINRYPGDGEYVLSKEEMDIFPYVSEALKKLKEAGFLIYIISNQACVSKGLISKQDLKALSEHILSSLESGEKLIEGVYYCIHKEEDNCPYRKPKPGLIREVFKRLNIEEPFLNNQSVFFVGDSIRDVKTAKFAGIKSILVLSGRESLENKAFWEVKPDYIFKDLQEAVDFIITQDRRNYFGRR